MSSVSVPPQTARLLRDRTGVQRVTNIELFFDLVYVFAVTQLSHYLLGHADLRGALQTGLLLLMVWLVWSYTTWVTNWLDPDLMAYAAARRADAGQPGHVGVTAAGVRRPGAWVGAAYAVQQIGRTVFMGDPGLVRGQQRVRHRGPGQRDGPAVARLGLAACAAGVVVAVAATGARLLDPSGTHSSLMMSARNCAV